MDWSTSDLTGNDNGIYSCSPSAYDEGIYLLDRDDPGPPRNFQSPIERYGQGGRSVAEYRDFREGRGRAPYERTDRSVRGAPQGDFGWPGRTPGDARKLNDIVHANYPEEVASFSNDAGLVWGGAVPAPGRNPCYPALSSSQAKDLVEGFAGGAAAGGADNQTLKYLVIFVLVCVLVLLVVGVVRQGKQIRKLLKETMLLLRAARGADSSGGLPAQGQAAPLMMA